MSQISGRRNLKLIGTGNFRYIVWEDFDNQAIFLSIVDVTTIPANPTAQQLEQIFYTGNQVKTTNGPVQHLDIAVDGPIIAIAHDEQIGSNLFSIALCETFNGSFPFNACVNPPQIPAEEISSVRVTIINGEPHVLFTAILNGVSTPGVFRH
jgi:hypothetical protein